MTIADPNPLPTQAPDDTQEVRSADRFANLDPGLVREKAGLSLTEMGALLGMGAIGYDLWEKGSRRPGGAAYRLLFLLNDNPPDVIATLTDAR